MKTNYKMFTPVFANNNDAYTPEIWANEALIQLEANMVAANGAIAKCAAAAILAAGANAGSTATAQAALLNAYFALTTALYSVHSLSLYSVFTHFFDQSSPTYRQ